MHTKFRKPQWKWPLGRPRCAWEHYIKIDLSNIVCKGVYGNQVAQDRVQWQAFVSTVMKYLSL
jgi:hypothetical protein